MRVKAGPHPGAVGRTIPAMIGYLRGVPRRLAEDSLLLDVDGVGYALQIPASTYGRLRAAGDGEAVELYVHTHVRDDALQLFGFATEGEKAIFERLIGVGGIGPRLAQVILSGMPADELVTALAAGDVARLVEIPGVGKRTAERMILELREKVRELAADLPAAGAPASGDDDLVVALVHLGYSPRRAGRAVAAVRDEMPEGEEAEMLKAALKRLSRA